jgi:hypothetical protein
MATSNTRTGISVGRVIPGLLVAGLLLDLASRFVPYDAVSFRAWEAMTRMPPSGRGGAFAPNRRYASDKASGDLSSMSNRPRLRQLHREVFTTDAFGFRETPRLSGKPDVNVAVVFGSSFTVGSTLSDEETLPAQLQPLLGGNVYNAGSAEAFDEESMDELLDRLALAPGATVVFESLDRFAPPTLATARRERPTLDSRNGRLRLVAAHLRGWLSPSPLQISLVHLRKALEDDRVLPNSSAPAALSERLANGDQMLFLPIEETLSRQADRPVDGGPAYWRHLDAHLRARGLRLLVVLVPTSYTVYAPLLAQPPVSPLGPTYLDRLEAATRSEGVDVVNLGPILARAAREGLDRHRYVFWRDDTHWNAAGVALAARAITDRLGPVTSR